MIGIVLTGHGEFPRGMHESIKLIAGEIKNLAIVPFKDDQDKLEQTLKEAIKNVDTGSGVVCFADLAGGTPFNVSAKIAATEENIAVIGGVNTPLLLSAVFQREQPLEEFINKVMTDGKENIKRFETKRRELSDDTEGI